MEGLKEFLVSASRGGSRNFRPLGGWPTRHGRRVAAGRVFRCGHIAEVEPGARPDLAGLGLRTVVTFQTAPEIEVLGDWRSTLLPEAACEHIPIGDRWFQEDATILDDLESQGDFYLRMVAEHPDAWARFFRVFARPDRYAVLFHCTAGRDRTGVAAAMLLETLGVPRPLIVEDYLRSNDVFLDSVQEAAVLDPLFGAIDAEGGIDPFLQGLGLDAAEVEAVREHLLIDS